MLKAIIFDCFGVIIIDAFTMLYSETAKGNQLVIDEAIAVINATSRGQMDVKESRTKVAALFNMSEPEWSQKIDTMENRNQPLLDFILELKQKYRTGLLSNTTKGGLDRRFSEKELNQHFDAVIASGEYGYAKPEAEIYNITAEQLGVDPIECVFIDDREDYCRGAKAVGMKAILYLDFVTLKQELIAILG